MIAVNQRTIIFFIFLYIVAVECLGGGARSGGVGSRANVSGKSSKTQGAKGFLGEPSAKAQTQSNTGAKPKAAGGRFLSAWGIISVIMLVILGSALIYYTSIFYPLVCAERGKYDVMEMTSL